MMDKMEGQLTTLVGKKYTSNGAEYEVAVADNFQYTDPVDGSVTKNQGLRLLFTDSSRIIFRLSGTGSSGATVRLYVDCYESNPEVITKDAQTVLKPLVDLALELSQMKQFTGREQPTVIT